MPYTMFFKYRFTKHARERFVERTNKKYANLHLLPPERRSEVLASITAYVEKNRQEVNRQMAAAIRSASDDRSYLNNTQFMDRFYRKYGYDTKFEFLVSDEANVVFVAAQDADGDGKAIVTCLSTNMWDSAKPNAAFRKRRKDVNDNSCLISK